MIMTRTVALAAVGAFFCAALVNTGAQETKPPASSKPIEFNRDIRPILSDNCFVCHGPDEAQRKAKLRLDDEASAKSDRKGDIAIVPGKPELSSLIQRIESKDPDEVMPPPKQHKTVTPEQLALLKAWIRQGAPRNNFSWCNSQTRIPNA